MLFNSLDFAIFLPTVFLLYWFVAKKNLKLQNALIVLASYVFYGWWDWRFLSLIIFSTVVDYLVGQKLRTEEKQSKRKVLLWTSILVNLGFLGFFKYYNFFLENFVDAFSLFGTHINNNSLNIILPVGISFYTFQTLSYTIDVYKKKLEPTQDIIAFSAFVCFFPQLVAGPIERATNLLPQFYKKRTFEYHKAVDGMRQILWGLFKKVVIADNCAVFVNSIYENFSILSNEILIIGVFLFSFQIYCDFSAYSDMAIGIAKLFGIKLSQNFSTPYFSRDIAEFWRRWHISLSTWFRDYLYIPLGGSRVSKFFQYRNLILVFLVSGLWHGANWTFIFWGLIHVTFYLPQLINKTNRNYLNIFDNNKTTTIIEYLRIVKTFILVSFAWIFFRSNSIELAINYIKHIFLNTKISIENSFFIIDNEINNLLFVTLMIIIMLIIECYNRGKEHGYSRMPKNIIIRHFSYIITCLLIIEYFNGETSFIYFQF